MHSCSHSSLTPHSKQSPLYLSLGKSKSKGSLFSLPQLLRIDPGLYIFFLFRFLILPLSAKAQVGLVPKMTPGFKRAYILAVIATSFDQYRHPLLSRKKIYHYQLLLFN
jgi:hypothetical protein